jgi:ribosomal protein L31
MKKVTIVCDICGNEVKDGKSYTLNLPTLEASNVVLSNRDCGTPNPVIKLREVDVCSKCHPYWTGNLRKDTTGGRADKFKKKYGIN